MRTYRWESACIYQMPTCFSMRSSCLKTVTEKPCFADTKSKTAHGKRKLPIY